MFLQSCKKFNVSLEQAIAIPSKIENTSTSQNNKSQPNAIEEKIVKKYNSELNVTEFVGTSKADEFRPVIEKNESTFIIDGISNDDIVYMSFGYDWTKVEIINEYSFKITEKHATGTVFNLKNIRYVEFSGGVRYEFKNSQFAFLKVNQTTQTNNSTQSPSEVNIPQDPNILSADLDIEPVNNEIVITEKYNLNLTNYPIQIGRAFKIGEILNYPTAYTVDGDLNTQSDIKQRHKDGSVKFAVISFILPNLGAKKSIRIAFKNKSTSQNNAISDSLILADEVDFDAEITLSNSNQTLIASARKMLEAGHYTYWTKGEINTTYILADHSENRAHDLGFDQFKSFRPIFHVSFWPSLKKAKIRMIGENGTFGIFQDLIYKIKLSIGHKSKKEILTEDNYIHSFGTRWNQTVWLGEEPSVFVNINHNLKYLSATQYVNNFNPQTISENKISSEYYQFKKLAKGFGVLSNGFWTRYMPTTGARAEIGPIPNWFMSSLYKGDWRSREIMIFHAEKALSWPNQFREGKSNLFYDKLKTVSAMGKPLSLNARPYAWFPDNNGNYPTDSNVNSTRLRSEYDSLSWVPDGAHQPDPFSIPYILTGDYLFLEQVQLWAATQAFAYNPNENGRGANGIAGIQDQIRGNAWVFRNRVNAAFLSPDSTSEKKYFEEIVDDAIAYWEGEKNLNSSTRNQNTAWLFANQKLFKASQLSPLGFWSKGGGSEGLWQDYFLMFSLGNAAEKGFNVSSLLTYFSPVLTSQLKDPSWDPKLMMEYYISIGTNEGKPYTQWQEVRDSIPDRGSQTITNFSKNYSYICYANAAASFLYNSVDGKDTWSYFQKEIRPDNTGLKGDYMSFDLIPRN